MTAASTVQKSSSSDPGEEKTPFCGRPQGVWQKSDTADAPKETITPTDLFSCVQCGEKLTRDDIGLHKKLINRGAVSSFLCRRCLAEKFKMTVEDCDTLIAHFKESGCSLFF